MSIAFARWFHEAQSPFVGGPQQALARAPVLAPAQRPVRTLARSTSWTLERIAALSAPEVSQLLANAERLQDAGIAARCRQVLSDRPAGEARSPAQPRKWREQRLVSRGTAFGLRGAALANRFWSRSGVTKGGGVVFALWAADVRYGKAGARHLLWAPNVGGARPWSDTPAGCERLEHCRRALKAGSALGLLVYGERLEGVLPDDRAAHVEGVEPGVVIPLQVEMRGEEYWAAWNGSRG